MRSSEPDASIQIRAVGSEAAQLLAGLHELCLAGGQSGATRWWTAEEFSNLLTMPSYRAFLATETSGQQDGMETPVGFAVGMFTRDEGDLLFIGVVPDHLRRGIGRIILDAFLADAKSLGVRTMLLEVAEGNEAARKLYARCGFHEIAKRRNYYRSDDGRIQNAVVMKFSF
jgi:ribosomal-protein-alanine N-acetyltransferase